MKKTKRLATAICLLVISALMLSTSSFAWFSMNTSVDVEGIEVEAYSDALFLEIATVNSEDEFDISAKFGTGNDEGKKYLRLVTHKFINDQTVVKVSAATITSNSLRYAEDLEYVAVSDTDMTAYDSAFTYYEYTVVTYDDAQVETGDDVVGLYVEADGAYTVTSDTVAADGVTYYNGVYGYDEVDGLSDTSDVSSYYLKVEGLYKNGEDTKDTYSRYNYVAAAEAYLPASSVAGFYKNLEFTLISSAALYEAYVPTADQTYVDGTTYYTDATGSDEVENLTVGSIVAGYYVANTEVLYTKGNTNVYTAVQPTALAGNSMKGYYRLTAGVTAEAAGAVYDGVSSYYKLEGGAYELVGGLELGAPLAGYKLVASEEVDIDNLSAIVSDGESIALYAVNSISPYAEYAYVGEFENDADFTNYVYWGRTYSSALGAVQKDNTLKVLSGDFVNYYYHDQLFLRNAENTNNAGHLRVESVQIGGRANDLSPALRVLFLATSTSGETSYAVYNHRDRSITHADGDFLFEKLLGNKQETVTVDVYIYFDGTDDAALTVANGQAGVLNGQTVKIEFAIDNQPHN